MSMQATADAGHAIGHEDAPAKRGFWNRFMSGLVGAREREARMRVSQFMKGMSDGQLKHIGYSQSEIGTLRSTGRLPDYFA